MIIRLYETTERSLVKRAVSAPSKGGGEFGCINLLMFTSIELRQRFGFRIADSDVASVPELIQAVGGAKGAPSGVQVSEERIAQLLEARPKLLPCFIGYQETPAGTVLPLMTDGPDGRWSLFFDQKGAMTLVEFSEGQWRITPDAELLPKIPRRSDPIAETKSFLLNGIRSARKMLVRSEDGSETSR
jgi:hypothetical protein